MHLSQLYAGFEMLHNQRYLNVKIRKAGRIIHPNFLEVYIDKSVKIVYDLCDGLNWTKGDFESNVQWFNSNVNCDIFFKRSYVPSLNDHIKKCIKILPLGLNYPISNRIFGWKNQLKSRALRFPLLKNLPIIRDTTLYANMFEHAPNFYNKFSVFFITRLWNPDESSSEESRNERLRLNFERINIIRRLKDFKELEFFGGVVDDSYSCKTCPDLTIKSKFTKRIEYIRHLKKSILCISTTGLHNSIPWKMGEYVAASRAILCEPLHYGLPGNFSENVNYNVFNNLDDLIRKINSMILNPASISEMMKANKNYYENYLRPDVFVKNTINYVDIN